MQLAPLKYLSGFTTRFWITLAVGLTAAVGVVWLISSLSGGRTARVEAKVESGRADAATASGRDAVGAVSGQAQSEIEADKLTRENEDEIRNADGADAPVADGVNSAGIRSLCKRAAYRGRPECVQFAPAE